MKMSSTSSDDEILGTEAEQEYERSLDRAALAEQTLEEPAPVKKTKSKSTAKRQRLTNAQRLSLIDGFRQGKTDKFFNVIPNKNKPGDYRIVRRRKPLDVPIADNSPDPIKDSEPEPPKEIPLSETTVKKDKMEKKDKYNTEFYTMQNTINNSLSKEIAAVMEKCNKIEAKMKKQKQKMKQQRNQRQYVPEEYPEEYMDEEEMPYEEPEYRYYPYRYGMRRRIDLSNF